MSFDFPIHIPDNSPEAKAIEAIVIRDHVSPEEVVRRAIRALAVPPPNANSAPPKSVAELLTDEMINELKSLDSSYGLLEDVPLGRIEQMEATIQRMKQEDFSDRG